MSGTGTHPLTSVLFACTYNAIRSPMAEALLKHFHGHRLYVDSVGVREGDPDPFMAVVMEEIGIDMLRHRPKTFDDLQDTSFDLVVSLSPEAQHHGLRYGVLEDLRPDRDRGQPGGAPGGLSERAGRLAHADPEALPGHGRSDRVRTVRKVMRFTA